MDLDQSTLVSIQGIKSIIASFLFYFLYVSLPRISGIFLWAIASLSIGFAILFDYFGLSTHPQLSSLLYNIPLVSGQVFFLFGTAKFVGRPFKAELLPVALFLIVLVAVTLTFIAPDRVLRLLAMAFIYVAANVWMALLLWRFRAAHSRFAYRIAAAIIFVQAAAALVQTLFAIDVKGFDFAAYVVVWFNAIATTIMGTWVLFLLIMLHLVEELKGMAEQKERERIARELHDTVLQTFQGFVMKADALLSESEPELKESLRRCVGDAITAIRIGRDKVATLRGDLSSYHALHEYLRQTGEQVAAPGQQFTLRCIGTARALETSVHRELCAIGKEALINAFRHANASTHEVLVHYDSRALILTIRDDGKGINLNYDNQGHWGIKGIEERAMLIQAKATLHTLRGEGTTWRIEVDAEIAYAESG